MATWWKRWRGRPRLSDERALELMVELWDCLAEHPEWSKADFFRRRNYGFMASSCPLCEHVYERYTPFSCRHCLLLGLWAEGRPESECQHPDSPYSAWMHTTDPSKKASSAKAVANLARGALARLRAERGERG